MPGVGTVWLNVKPDMTGFGAAIKTGAGAQGDAAGTTLGQRMGKNMGAQIKGLVGPALAGLTLAGGAALIKGSIAEAREAEKVAAQTRAGIKSTGGIANVTAGQIDALAGRLSAMAGVDDELIAKSSNLLLTFTNVRNEAGKGNDVFNQATAAALDLSAKGFGSVDGAAKMMGKALNDPIKGISALGRAGVTFTAQQKEQIKTLTETGDLLGAQKIILGEVQKQVGGAAKAAADPVDKLKVSWGNLQESIGEVLLPVLNKLVPILTDVAKWVGKNADVIIPLAGAMGTLALAIGAIVLAMKAWNAVQTAWSAITKVATGVQAAFNLVMSLNPIALVVIAIVALVAAIVILYKKSETFRDLIATVWNAIKVAAEAVWNGIKFVITKAIDGIVWYVTTWFNVIKTIITTAIDVVKTVIKAGVDAVLAVWRTLGKIVEVVGDVFDRVKRGIGRIIDWFKDLGGKIIHGLWDGIKAMAGWIGDKIKGFAKTMLGPFAKVLGIKSPSTVFASYGRDIVRGLARGVERTTPVAVASMNRLASAVSAPGLELAGAPTPGSVAAGAGGSSSAITVTQHINGALDPVTVGRVAADELAWTMRTRGGGL